MKEERKEGRNLPLLQATEMKTSEQKICRKTNDNFFDKLFYQNY